MACGTRERVEAPSGDLLHWQCTTQGVWRPEPLTGSFRRQGALVDSSAISHQGDSSECANRVREIQARYVALS